ncbi:MAG: hypothetical protein WCK89_10755 [bacterium]
MREPINSTAAKCKDGKTRFTPRVRTQKRTFRFDIYLPPLDELAQVLDGCSPSRMQNDILLSRLTCKSLFLDDYGNQNELESIRDWWPSRVDKWWEARCWFNLLIDHDEHVKGVGTVVKEADKM